MRSWPTVYIPDLSERFRLPPLSLFNSSDAALNVVPQQDAYLIYVCGITPYDATHMGHAATYLAFDTLVRAWRDAGHSVHYVQNVTDIDDKVLDNAQAGGVEEWWALAYRMEAEFTAAYDLLGIQRPSYEPRATASIPEMIAIIERLIERGHAYPAADNSGDVYFDTASWSSYGELTNQKPAEMEAAADADMHTFR